jgi:phosphodiesterase/alkaline phosphatase D-like protein
MSYRLHGATALVAAALPLSIAAGQATSFLAVAAGDADSTSAVLWTRATDGTSNALGLTAQVSVDPGFGSLIASYPATTAPATRDSTARVLATGLTPGTTYYYRFVAPDSSISGVGRFRTAPAAGASVPVALGFSGDADGQWRPYSSSRGLPGHTLDAYIWLGDTIYETGSGGAGPNASAACALPDTNLPQALADYRRKYREQFIPTTAGGFPGLTGLFSGQGNYTLLDNHELGNRQFINGGAPANAVFNDTDPSKDVNTTGTFINRRAEFTTLVEAFSEYQPIREAVISAPADPRTDGTLRQFAAHQWGKNVVYIQTDDRSYRDIRLRAPSGGSFVDDTGPRANNPGRTMLGQTQLAWLEQQLLAAQSAGTVWKVVSVSDPIDQQAPIGGSLATAAGALSDGGKSWMGGYRFERNVLMTFLASNHITDVIFLATDDHQARINELGYFDDITNQATYRRLDRVYSIVAGPIGAGGPDLVTDHSFANIQVLAASIASAQQGAGIDPYGIDPGSPLVSNVRREGDPSADATRSLVDFYSPDTFNYCLLSFAADGLSVHQRRGHQLLRREHLPRARRHIGPPRDLRVHPVGGSGSVVLRQLRRLHHLPGGQCLGFRLLHECVRFRGRVRQLRLLDRRSRAECPGLCLLPRPLLHGLPVAASFGSRKAGPGA